MSLVWMALNLGVLGNRDRTSEYQLELGWGHNGRGSVSYTTLWLQDISEQLQEMLPAPVSAVKTCVTSLVAATCAAASLDSWLWQYTLTALLVLAKLCVFCSTTVPMSMYQYSGHHQEEKGHIR